MILIASILTLCLALSVATPMVLFTLECAAAIFAGRQQNEPCKAPRPKLAILVPAHNEEKTIQATLAAMLPQMGHDDRIVVVADNCTDRTGEFARQAGASVIERHQAGQRGKGYALDFGVRYFNASPPDILIVVDADCFVEPGSLDALASSVMKTGRPAQAIYTMEPPAHARPRDFISAFAFLVKNHVRPLGCNLLGWPCLLTGTGMAFPWSAIRDTSLASGNIVEDMQLGLVLALANHTPRLCPGAHIISRLPETSDAAASQRKRWEHGHLQTLLHWVPKLVVSGFSQKRGELLALSMQLCVPPLALLVLTWMGATILAALARVFLGVSWLPMFVLAGSGALMFITVAAVWHRFSRALVPARSLLSIPFYVTWKLPLYAAFLFRRQKAWVRTVR